jgi:hypothetical protein
MAWQSKSFGPRPYRAVAGTLFRLLRIFVPLLIVAAAFYFFIENPQVTTGRLRIVSNVKGADIYIDGVQVGAFTDTTLPEVGAGRRSISVKKAGYIAEPEVAFVTVLHDTCATVNFRLAHTDTSSKSKSDSLGFVEPPFADISMDLEDSSQPSSSTLAIDTELIDTSELEALEGTLTQRLRSISQATEKTPSPLRQDLEGTTIAVSSNPSGAQIIINGDTTDYRTNCTFRDFRRGGYVISVFKKGYVTKPETVRIDLVRNHQSELISFDLTAEKAQTSAQLTISTEPIEAPIRVDGRLAGKGRVVLEEPFAKVLVKFDSVAGYRTPAPQTVALTVDTPSVEIVGTYERLEGKAMLAVVPARGDFRDASLRVWVDNRPVVENPGGKFDGVLIQRLLAGDRLLRVQYQDLSQEINVELTDEQVTVVTAGVETLFSVKKLHLRAERPISLKTWQKRTRGKTIIEQD